jgi:hypothetical protein
MLDLSTSTEPELEWIGRVLAALRARSHERAKNVCCLGQAVVLH